MTDQTIDERLTRIKELERDIAAVPGQMKTLRDQEAAMRSERESLVTAVREEMGGILRLRKPKAASATPAASPRRPAGSPTRAPNEAPTATA